MPYGQLGRIYLGDAQEMRTEQTAGRESMKTEVGLTRKRTIVCNVVASFSPGHFSENETTSVAIKILEFPHEAIPANQQYM